MRFYLAAPLILTLLVVSGPSSARDWQVPAQAPTIAAAIDSAASGDVIVIACGTYAEHDLELKNGLTLRSATGAANCVTVDAEGLGRAFLCEEIRDVTLQGLTITGGFSDSGGAILCTNDFLLTLQDCVLTGNGTLASYCEGGAIWTIGSGSLVANGCLFQNNQAHTVGGAIVMQYGTTLDLDHCTIVDNVTDGSVAGAIYVWEATVLAEYTAIANNLAAGSRHDVELAQPTSFAQLHCCDVDLAYWDGEGTVTLDNEGCGTPIQQRSWGHLKSLYR
jgi:hypothetical protein